MTIYIPPLYLSVNAYGSQKEVVNKDTKRLSNLNFYGQNCTLILLENIMKLLFSIIAASLIVLSGLSAALGFNLPKITPDKGSPYSFGHHYDYNNAGSNWNLDRVYRYPGHRHRYSRWYYHYGHQPQPFKEHRYYPYGKYSYPHKKHGYYPGIGFGRHKAHIYSRHKYAPKGYAHRKHIQLKNRIPSHSFKHTGSFNRVRIGR